MYGDTSRKLDTHIGQLRTSREVAAYFDIAQRTLQVYEDEGLITPHKTGDERFFGPSDLVRIEAILKARRLGFSMHETKTLLNRGAALGERMTRDDDIGQRTVGLERQPDSSAALAPYVKNNND